MSFPRFLVLGLLSQLFPSFLEAAENRIVRPVDPSRAVVLRGRSRARPAARFDRGPANPAMELHSVTLVMRPAAGLDELLAEQQNRGSAEYHKWLTPEQFADRFGLSQADVRSVSSWLQSQGLRVEPIARGRLWISFSGSVARINRAFRSEIHQYEVDGATHYADAVDPSIPEAFAGVAESVEGLSDFGMRPLHVRPMLTMGTGHLLAPDDFATIYNAKQLFNAGYDGSGQAIAVVGQTSIDLADIRAFRRRFNLQDKDPQMVLTGPDPGRRADDMIEADLDVEWAGAIAPGALIYYVYSTNVLTSVQYAIDQNLAPVLSMSYGGCEQTFGTTWRYLAQQANAQGITWLAASGDRGAATCDLTAQTPQASKGPTVDWPASIPEITGVGGTQFEEAGGNFWSTTNNASSGSALSYIPEVVWNEAAQQNSLVSGGGGASVYYAKPAWQSGPGVPNDNARDVPDISFAASAGHNGYQIFSGGSLQTVGGTSASTPAFAGILALVNQYLTSNGVLSRPGLGNINPVLYRLAQSTGSVFHDVTAGDNKVPCVQSSPGCVEGLVGYAAGTGYDLATGLGSADAYRLATSWVTGSGTTVSLSATPNNPSLDDNMQLTAQVAAAGGGQARPTGSVTFTSAGTLLGAANLNGNGEAILSASAFRVAGGNGTVAAVYSGDRVYDSSAGSLSVSIGLPASGSVVIPAITPNPVYQSGSNWVFTIRLSEQAGVASRLTGFELDGVSTPVSFFGSGEIPAKGTTSVSLMVTLPAPRDLLFVFTGIDADGRTWTRRLTVPFLGPAGPTLAPSMTLTAPSGTVAENPQAAATCRWAHSIGVQEQSGYLVQLTRLAAGATDLTDQIQQIFGTTRLAPFGGLQGTVCWNALSASRTYQLTGMAENGAVISASVTARFAPAPAAAATAVVDTDSVTLTGGGPASVRLSFGGGSPQWSVAKLPANRTTSWLTVGPISGAGNGEIHLDANPAGLSSGVYRALVTIQAGDALPQSIQVPVTLIVGASDITRIAGAANNFSGLAMFAPGMLTSVYGSQLAPAGTFQAAGSLPLPIKMAGVSATVNGIAAPLYFVSPGQVNLQIPYEAGSGPAVLAINNNGQVAAFPIEIRTAAPGIATAPDLSIAASGKQGHVMVLYLTGDGDQSPAIATGATPPSGTALARLPKARLPLSVTVGGVPAEIAFAGVPPGLAGVTQINFTVPPTAPPGKQFVVVTAGGVASQNAILNVTQ